MSEEEKQICPWCGEPKEPRSNGRRGRPRGKTCPYRCDFREHIRNNFLCEEKIYNMQNMSSAFDARNADDMAWGWFWIGTTPDDLADAVYASVSRIAKHYPDDELLKEVLRDGAGIVFYSANWHRPNAGESCTDRLSKAALEWTNNDPGKRTEEWWDIRYRAVSFIADEIGIPGLWAELMFSQCYKPKQGATVEPIFDAHNNWVLVDEQRQRSEPDFRSYYHANELESCFEFARILHLKINRKDPPVVGNRQPKPKPLIGRCHCVGGQKK